MFSRGIETAKDFNMSRRTSAWNLKVMVLKMSLKRAN